MTSFGGEAFLSHVPPDPVIDRRRITFAVISTSVFFLFFLPPAVAAWYERRRSDDSTSTSTSISSTRRTVNGKIVITKRSTVVAAASTTGSSDERNGGGGGGGKVERERGGGKKSRRTKNSASTNADTAVTTAVTAPDDRKKAELPGFVLPMINVTWLCCVVLLVLLSSNNRYSIRRTFEAPLLTPEECDVVVAMAEAAARKNHDRISDGSSPATEDRRDDDDDGDGDDDRYEAPVSIDEEDRAAADRFAEWPEGWHKARHNQYPTTDLNLVTDPFTKEDRAWLAQRLDARLAPLIERIHGVVPGALRANDVFVVRYDASRQNRLREHTDSSDVSFNVLLGGGPSGDDFEGGGTRFYRVNLDDEYGERNSYLVRPEKGRVLVHDANVMHEGVATTKGTRYVLVGFCDVDAVDPIRRRRATELSRFASWFSVSWIYNRAKAGYRNSLEGRRSRRAVADGAYGRGLFRDLVVALKVFADTWGTHEHVPLVARGDDDAYLRALDAAHGRYDDDVDAGEDDPNRATWFKGQQIARHYDGSYAYSWTDRREQGEKFEEL